MDDHDHIVRALWIRPVEAGRVEARPFLQLVAGSGVEGDHSFGRLRHVTLVFQDDWDTAARSIGQSVDPIGRRANVLLAGGGGGRLVGARLRLGEALLEIKGVTAPCPVMERAAAGMMEALRPDARAGIWARVLEGGRVQLGDRCVEEVPGQKVHEH